MATRGIAHVSLDVTPQTEVANSDIQIGALCRRCGRNFAARPRLFFAGLQSFKCPKCKAAVVYPLTPGWRALWWAIAILTSVALVWANIGLHEGYSWIPAGIGLTSFVMLC